MTCIVGLVRDGNVWIGGDRMGSDGQTKIKVTRPKVFHNGEFVIGYTQCFRLGQLLEFAWKPPFQHTDLADVEYLCGPFVDSVSDLIGAHDINIDGGPVFMFAYRGNLYTIEGNMCVLRHEEYHAIGSGYSEAHGALHAMIYIDNNSQKIVVSPEAMIRVALESAAEHRVNCGLGHDILCQEITK